MDIVEKEKQIEIIWEICKNLFNGLDCEDSQQIKDAWTDFNYSILMYLKSIENIDMKGNNNG